MITCSQVRKSYRQGGESVEALRGVDLRIELPGFYGIMGASGSGKSTLLHLLAGLDQPDSGELTVSGTRLLSLSERDLTLFRRTKVGIIFQQFNLIPTLTASENVELPGVLAGEDAAKLRKRSTELLEILGVGHRLTHRPDSLSGGEQQRVAIARALLVRPGVILADEPTGNLDSASSRKLWALLRDVAAEQQVTIVMVTHEPAAAAHCSRVFILKDGTIGGSFETEGLDASGVATRYQQLVA
jgi:putative ABC transport system ATP-binding protein